jgi:hypothetical protein
MDETGLSVRPLKGKRRKVVFLRTCHVTPSFHDERDVSHVSLVARVTLGGQSLLPLSLTTVNIPFKSEELTVLCNMFVTYKTPRGYMTKESMNFYLKSAIAPSVEFLRLTAADPL